MSKITDGLNEAFNRYNRRDSYQRDYDNSVAGMGKRQSYAYQQDGGANDEGWDEPQRDYTPKPVSKKGMYFYNVPADQEDKANEVGLFKTKSGKWYSPFQNSRADMFFGKGRYWEPKTNESQLDELSNDTLASYKKKAGADASAADKAGDYKRGDKRFSGIVKATNKELDNDVKQSNARSQIKTDDKLRAYYAQRKAEKQGVEEGWQDDTQELEDWSKEVNKRLYRAHESQRPALARQLSKVEQKNFGSTLNQGGLTELIHSALRALQKGQMVHYDPQSVGQMAFGSLVGDDARIIAAAGVSSDELAGYRMLSDKGIVDNIQQFLQLRRAVYNKEWPQEYLDEFAGRPGALWLQFVEDLGWSKDDMNEEKQRLDPKCWDGYKKQGTKMKGDTRVNNCVPVKESAIMKGLR
jgi:hypothetical protein